MFAKQLISAKMYWENCFLFNRLFENDKNGRGYEEIFETRVYSGFGQP